MTETFTSKQRKPAVTIVARRCPFCGMEPDVLSSGIGFLVACENNGVCPVLPRTARVTRRTTAISYWNGSKPPRSGT